MSYSTETTTIDIASVAILSYRTIVPEIIHKASSDHVRILAILKVVYSRHRYGYGWYSVNVYSGKACNESQVDK